MFKRLIVSGCSQTYGHGLDDISLSNSNGKVDYSKGPSTLGNYDKVINLSMPAASNKRIAHIITSVDNLNENDTVIFCWTFNLRTAIIKPNGDYKFLHAHKIKGANDYALSKQWVEFRAKAEGSDLDIFHDNLVWASFANSYAKRKTSKVYNYSVCGDIWSKELQEMYNVPIIKDFQKFIMNFPPALDGSHGIRKSIQ